MLKAQMTGPPSHTSYMEEVEFESGSLTLSICVLTRDRWYTEEACPPVRSTGLIWVGASIHVHTHSHTHIQNMGKLQGEPEVLKWVIWTRVSQTLMCIRTIWGCFKLYLDSFCTMNETVSHTPPTDADPLVLEPHSK